MTKREQVLEALFSIVSDAMNGLGWSGVARNLVVPTEIPERGLAIMRDGDPGNPEVTLSPLTYHWQHRAEIEIYVQSPDSDLDAVFDAVAAALGTAIAGDTTLGGRCDWVEPMAPAVQTLAVPGGADIKAAVIAVTLHYDTTGPLA